MVDLLNLGGTYSCDNSRVVVSVEYVKPLDCYNTEYSFIFYSKKTGSMLQDKTKTIIRNSYLYHWEEFDINSIKGDLDEVKDL